MRERRLERNVGRESARMSAGEWERWGGMDGMGASKSACEKGAEWVQALELLRGMPG